LAHPLGVKGFRYRRVKNDVRDAADLADLLRMGPTPPTHRRGRPLDRPGVLPPHRSMPTTAGRRDDRQLDQSGPAPTYLRHHGLEKAYNHTIRRCASGIRR